MNYLKIAILIGVLIVGIGMGKIFFGRVTTKTITTTKYLKNEKEIEEYKKKLNESELKHKNETNFFKKQVALLEDRLLRVEHKPIEVNVTRLEPQPYTVIFSDTELKPVYQDYPEAIIRLKIKENFFGRKDMYVETMIDSNGLFAGSKEYLFSGVGRNVSILAKWTAPEVVSKRTFIYDPYFIVAYKFFDDIEFRTGLTIWYLKLDARISSEKKSLSTSIGVNLFDIFK